VDLLMAYFWTPAKPEGNIFGELGQIIRSKRADNGSLASSAGESAVSAARNYWMIPLLAFFSRKATSKADTWPLFRWMTEIRSECCALAMLMPLTIMSVTL
jgi:hypothetical protein